MSKPEFSARPSLEYLKKVAKQRLRELRESRPEARLAEAQLAVAREQGFSSWRELRAEVERRRAPALREFFTACRTGDVALLERLLDADASLIRELDESGGTPLHAAARHAPALKLLLARGADANARDTSDNALALHYAAQAGQLEAVRQLLDAGSDVHGRGDVHRLDVIGWASVLAASDARDVVGELAARGARHHIFSAICLGDLELLERVASEPQALARRLSRFEQEQTALHFLIAPPDGKIGGTFRNGGQYPMLELLIEAGADVHARDAQGRTPLALAMLRGDREATRRLRDAGAQDPEVDESRASGSATARDPSLHKLTPMLRVESMDASIAFYQTLGFALRASHEHDGRLDWAAVASGDAEIMLVPAGDQPTRGVSLWIATQGIDELHARLKRLQMQAARSEATEVEVRFEEDLYTTFYGPRQFSIRDPSGVTLVFTEPVL